MRLRNKLLLAVTIPVVVLATAVAFIPWKEWLEAELRTQLAERGLEKLEFEITGIDLDGITFGNVSMGQGSPFNLESVTVGYNWRDLLEGRVDGGHTGPLSFKYKDIEVKAGRLDIDLEPMPEKGHIMGKWYLREAYVTGLPVPVPMLQGQGTLELKDQLLKVTGDIASEDTSYRAIFATDYPANKPQNASVIIDFMQVPWNGGMVRTKDVAFQLFGKEPVQTTLRFDSVSLNSLMQQATADKASATGAMSGKLPLTISRAGNVTIQGGSLKTQENGTLTLAPDIIPGDHPQVEVVREILRNFHYTDFSLTIDSDNPKKLSMLLSLKGNNPDVYNGRKVNLNVRLTGDLIDLIRQGMVTIVDPKQLLNREQDETP